MEYVTLKAARVNCGLSQENIAQEIGVSSKTIIDWEKNPAKVPYGKFKKMCLIYGVPTDCIFLPNG